MFKKILARNKKKFKVQFGHGKIAKKKISIFYFFQSWRHKSGGFNTSIAPHITPFRLLYTYATSKKITQKIHTTTPLIKFFGQIYLRPDRPLRRKNIFQKNTFPIRTENVNGLIREIDPCLMRNCTLKAR